MVTGLPRPNPAGFGRCRVCAYAATGPAEICYPCAKGVVEPVAEHRCLVCDQTLEDPGAQCRNYLCRSPERHFDMSYAIAMKTGPLEQAIHQYKFNQRWGWGLVFARVVNGYLLRQQHAARR